MQDISLTPGTDGVPRIEDLSVASMLGFANPLMIRKLISRHAESLIRFGVVLSIVEKTLPQGGRPGRTYFLNEHQALYICTKSETPNAVEITIRIVEAFVAYRRGETPGRADPRVSAAVKRMAKAVHSREEVIWRKMMAIHGVVDPLSMTPTQVKLCLEWCELGGQYCNVGPEIWRQRCWPECDWLHNLVRRAAERNDTSLMFWYKRLVMFDDLEEALEAIGPAAWGPDWRQHRPKGSALVLAG